MVVIVNSRRKISTVTGVLFVVATVAALAAVLDLPLTDLARVCLPDSHLRATG